MHDDCSNGGAQRLTQDGDGSAGCASPASSAKTLAAIAAICGRQHSALVPEAKLGEDLGFDNLEHMELMLDLELLFEIEISDEDAHGLTTVAEVVAYIGRRTGRGA